MIANLREKVANAASKASEKAYQAKIADAAERRAILTRIARRSGKNPVAGTKAIDVLNKMDGVYVQKHEQIGPVQVVVSPADERL